MSDKHYKEMEIEPWDVIDGWSVEQKKGFYRGNVIKYCMRIGSKDEELTEAVKLLHYAQKLVDVLESENK
jgi:hypothetical protein